MKKTPLRRKTSFRTKRSKLRSKVPSIKNGIRVGKRGKRGSEGQIEANKAKPRASSVTLSKLKEKLDKIFSIYIRRKYPKVCYTCGRTAVTLQNGHYISRQYLVTRWDERNCRPQCVGCNMFGGGKPLDFEEKLKNELGEAIVEEMKHSRHQLLKVDRPWYEEKIAFYENEVKKYD